jgi:hypothetical protein
VRSTNPKCTRGCGCNGHPAFPTPSVFLGRKLHTQLGRTAPRGREVVSWKACHESVIARSGATKQSILSLRGKMDCFASLAMTAPHLDRLCCLKLEPRHCEERSDEAIHTFFCARWIASRTLSSGAHSRDPLARNDGRLFDPQGPSTHEN